MSDPPQKKPLHDARIRQQPVARWENEGGATTTGHKSSITEESQEIKHPVSPK